jgi:predicted transcriptional regulator
MHAYELISALVPVISVHDDTNRVLDLMDEYNVEHLPLIKEHKLIGILSKEYLMDHPELSLASVDLVLPILAARKKSHVFEVFNLYKEFKTTIIPVVDDEGLYIGSITQDTMLEYLITGVQSHEPGGILIISCPVQEYSLSQIARIFENENVTILSMLVHPINDLIYITLKANRHDLRALTASLDRHNYTVEQCFSENNSHDGLLDNYNSLMKYLDI